MYLGHVLVRIEDDKNVCCYYSLAPLQQPAGLYEDIIYPIGSNCCTVAFKDSGPLKLWLWLYFKVT